MVEPASAEWAAGPVSRPRSHGLESVPRIAVAAATSNRNFEGRQGKGGRTHLVSPLVAAATAIRGTLSSPWDLGLDTGSASHATDAGSTAEGQAR